MATFSRSKKLLKQRTRCDYPYMSFGLVKGTVKRVQVCMFWPRKHPYRGRVMLIDF